MPKPWKIFAYAFFWFVAVSVGMHALMTYKGKPGPVGLFPQTWPKSELNLSPTTKPLLLMFAHPRCPCTTASLGELELLAAQAKDKFDAAVLFFEPEGGSDEWISTTTIDLARSIPNVRVILDKDGTLAKQFGAKTSGQTLVYSSDGRLLFSGGITGSRGHLGENSGFDSVLKIVRNESTSLAATTTKVFGCGIFEQQCASHPTANSN